MPDMATRVRGRLSLVAVTEYPYAGAARVRSGNLPRVTGIRPVPLVAAIHMRRGNPFGDAAGWFSGCPAVVGDEAVVGSAGQGEVVDVGVPAVSPVGVGVMDLAPGGGHGAAG